MEWLSKLIGILFSKTEELPKWAHGLECKICWKTFKDAHAHYSHVVMKSTYKNHSNKIPVLRRK